MASGETRRGLEEKKAEPAKELRERMSGQSCANCGHLWRLHSTPDRDGYLSQCNEETPYGRCRCTRWRTSTFRGIKGSGY